MNLLGKKKKEMNLLGWLYSSSPKELLAGASKTLWVHGGRQAAE